MNKSQILSASRAGLSSAIVTNAGTSQTQIISNLGAVSSVSTAPVVTAQVFVIHPFV